MRGRDLSMPSPDSQDTLGLGDSQCLECAPAPSHGTAAGVREWGTGTLELHLLPSLCWAAILHPSMERFGNVHGKGSAQLCPGPRTGMESSGVTLSWSVTNSAAETRDWKRDIP